MANAGPDPLPTEVILPSLLACLSTSFASPKPPPSLLPLLSPTLRQRLLLFSAGSSDPWLGLLCRNPAGAAQLTDLIQSHADAFEPHPVSGEIEIEESTEPKYCRIDSETLNAKVELKLLEVIVTFVWCPNDVQGLDSAAGWRISEITPLVPGENSVRLGTMWRKTVEEVENDFKKANAREDELQEANRSLLVPSRSDCKLSESDNDDSYWQQYDNTPSERPAPKVDISGAQGPNEDDYFQRYASVQPEMDADDPSSEVDHQKPTQATTVTQIPQQPANNDQDQLESGVRTHISSSIKSLWRLSRTTGISRADFTDLVEQQLQLLEMYEEDEEYK